MPSPRSPDLIEVPGCGPPDQPGLATDRPMIRARHDAMCSFFMLFSHGSASARSALKAAADTNPSRRRKPPTRQHIRR
jgi:hypothetical protein